MLNLVTQWIGGRFGVRFAFVSWFCHLYLIRPCVSHFQPLVSFSPEFLVVLL